MLKLSSEASKNASHLHGVKRQTRASGGCILIFDVCAFNSVVANCCSRVLHAPARLLLHPTHSLQDRRGATVTTWPQASQPGPPSFSILHHSSLAFFFPIALSRLLRRLVRQLQHSFAKLSSASARSLACPRPLSKPLIPRAASRRNTSRGPQLPQPTAVVLVASLLASSPGSGVALL